MRDTFIRCPLGSRIPDHDDGSGLDVRLHYHVRLHVHGTNGRAAHDEGFETADVGGRAIPVRAGERRRRSVMVNRNETGDKSPPVALRARRLIPLDPRAGFDACLHSHGDPPRSLIDADDGSGLDVRSHSHDVLHGNGTNGHGGRDEGLRQQT